jgi:tetratricopeptide (TPR) repeat protein
MSLVEMALASPSHSREQYLKEACGGDIALLELVQGYVDWERRMDGFLSEPLYPRRFLEHPFEAGELLHERFRIIREIARGGMGIVYEALDEKLNRRIALKCAKAGFRKRLPPEVRNASDISHPNVCKTFEIHTASTIHGDVDFLTMEFLYGETLAERLRREPLSEKDARNIALQLCAGLTEAHRKHVVHGDLKSNNVIFTTDGGEIRAVITDFGLAQRPDSTTRALQSSQMAGTPDYMAPELWKGAKPSIASDIYALGVILQELLPGLRWSRVSARCTHPDPARRFHSAEEVANAIDPRSRRWFVAAAAAAVLAVASGVVSYRTATAPKETVRLAMLPFEGAPEGLSRDIADRLSGLKGSPQTKFIFVQKRVATMEEAHARLGATHLLQGEVEQKDGRVFVHASLFDARSQTRVKEWKTDYDPRELRYAPTALAGMVTGTFHFPALTEAAEVNAAARQEYKSGLLSMPYDTKADAALASMQKAVAADPDSPLTHAGLAEAWWSKYFVTKNRKYLELAAQSLANAQRRNGDLAEVHLIAGRLQAEYGYFEPAVAEYQRSIELDPASSDAHRRLGQAYGATGQDEQAFTELRRAIELDAGNHRNSQALGHFYNQRAQYGEAIKHYARAVELAPYEPEPQFALAAGYMDDGRFVDAERELRAALVLGETATVLDTLGMVLIYQGKDQEAIPYLTRALQHPPEKYVTWLILGVAYGELGLVGESKRSNQRGLTLAEEGLAINPRDNYARASAAYLCARLGDKRRANAEIAQVLRAAPSDLHTRWMVVFTLEALGRRDDTLALLKSSPKALLADIRRFPNLADLARDPRFVQIWSLKRDK